MSLARRKKGTNQFRDLECDDGPPECSAGAAWWAVRNMGVELRKETGTRNVDLRDVFPDVISESTGLDETAGDRR